MPVTRTAARDEILAAIKAVTDTIIDLEDDDTVPSGNVIWDDTQKSKPHGQGPNTPTWARVSVRHIFGEQSSLSDDAGVRRYTKRGIVTVQLFTPTGGLVSADSISDTIENAFRGVSTPNGVWFRNPRSNEIGVDGPWFQTNIIAEFEYDQVA